MPDLSSASSASSAIRPSSKTSPAKSAAGSGGETAIRRPAQESGGAGWVRSRNRTWNGGARRGSRGRLRAVKSTLERQVLVRAGARCRLPYLVDERAEAAVEPRADAADQGVPKGPDQPLGLRAAALDRRADEEVLLAAGPREDGGPGSQEGRSERRPEPAAELAEGRGERRRQHAVDLAGEESRRRGAVEVGRQSQDGKRRGELAPPRDRPRRRAPRPRGAASARAHSRRTGRGARGAATAVPRRRPRRAPRPLARGRGSIHRRRRWGERRGARRAGPPRGARERRGRAAPPRGRTGAAAPRLRGARPRASTTAPEGLRGRRAAAADAADSRRGPRRVPARLPARRRWCAGSDAGGPPRRASGRGGRGRAGPRCRRCGRGCRLPRRGRSGRGATSAPGRRRAAGPLPPEAPSHQVARFVGAACRPVDGARTARLFLAQGDQGIDPRRAARRQEVGGEGDGG